MIRLDVFFKGAAMGAADIVPGVSGGTIAFITGIYERLISALSNIRLERLKTLRHSGLRAAWDEVDGAFLITLFSGVLLSVLTLAGGISYLLNTYPHFLWAFFFGLILGSVFLVGKQIKQKTSSRAALFIVGAVVAFLLTEITPTAVKPTHVAFFLSGCIAICAMILPGISGSFILLLLGMYGPVLSAVKGFDILPMTIFACGCVIGLLSFTRLLNWLLKQHHDLTLAVLTGFMVGALNKVWPWKQTVEFRKNAHGEEIPLIQENVFPGFFEQVTGGSSQIGWVILLMLTGLFCVLVLEKLRFSYQK